MDTIVREAQLKKVYFSMHLIPRGKITESNLVQLSKAYLPIDWSVSGRVMLNNFEQFSNALLPIVVTPSGITIDWILVEEKALLPMVCNVEGKLTVTSLS